MNYEQSDNVSKDTEQGQLRQDVVVPSTSDFALRAEAEWKATDYDIAQMRLDEIGVPTELHQGGDRLSIVGRINILWRRAMKAESDLETINLRHGLKL